MLLLGLPCISTLSMRGTWQRMVRRTSPYSKEVAIEESTKGNKRGGCPWVQRALQDLPSRARFHLSYTDMWNELKLPLQVAGSCGKKKDMEFFYCFWSQFVMECNFDPLNCTDKIDWCICVGISDHKMICNNPSIVKVENSKLAVCLHIDCCFTNV